MRHISYDERVNSLRKYNLLNPVFSDQTKNAFNLWVESVVLVCNVPVSTISLFYEKEIQFVAQYGSLKDIGSLKLATDYYRLLTDELFEVKDTQLDPLFKDFKGFMNNDVRYFASYTIFDPNGIPLGSLNIYDHEPRSLNDDQKEYIKKVTRRITQIILERRTAQVSHLLETLFYSSDDLIAVSHNDGKLLRINPAFANLLGHPLDEILNSNMEEFVHPEDIASLLNAADNKMQHGTYKFTTRLISKHNEVKHISWVGISEDKTGLNYSVGRDISGLVEQQYQLKKSEKRFRDFFEHSQSLSCMHRLDGVFLSVNKTGADMAGYEVDEIIGKSLFQIVPADRHNLLREYLQVIRTKGQASGTMKVITKQGEIRTWMFSNVLQKDDNGQDYVIGNAVDLTERVELEKELTAAKLSAEQASLAKSEFLANMSHEIRTPLNGIIGFTDLISKSNLDQTQRQYINIINQSGTTLLTIINDILDFSKIEAGKLFLNREKIDLQDVAAQACTIISYAVEKKGLELLFDFSADLPRYIWADEVRLKQVLVNLLGNAVKFTEKGEVELKITPLQEFSDGRTTIRFEIRDTGIGIKKEMQAAIFDAFAQEDSSITKKYGGTGLGLTISNRILKIANSQLCLNSSPGKGSCFYFDVTFKSEKESPDDGSLKEIKSILVVDDNENNRRILKHMLQLKKIEVDAVEGGLQALILLQSGKKYDVIIMDYHMPIMDGIETIRKIKGNIQHEEQPIIMLYSSSDNDQLQEACDELKVESRLVKPIKMREMYQVLARLKKENLERSNEMAEKNASNTEQEGSFKRTLKVLVAEDNEVNMFLTKSIIKQIAPESTILEARDGKQAVEQYKQGEPDIILMDVQMPNLNGIEATKAIRKIQKTFHVPILALTAGAMNDEREKCLEAGMDDFMTKPIVKQTIASMFKKWVGSEVVKESTSSPRQVPTDHIDRAWFNEYTSADPSFKEEFIALIKTELKDSSIILTDQVAKKDLNGLKKTGHKLKGTSLTAGLTELSKLAIAFELLNDLEEAYVKELLRTTIDEINVVLELLELE